MAPGTRLKTNRIDLGELEHGSGYEHVRLTRPHRLTRSTGWCDRGATAAVEVTSENLPAVQFDLEVSARNE